MVEHSHQQHRLWKVSEAGEALLALLAGPLVSDEEGVGWGRGPRDLPSAQPVRPSWEGSRATSPDPATCTSAHHSQWRLLGASGLSPRSWGEPSTVAAAVLRGREGPGEEGQPRE